MAEATSRGGGIGGSGTAFKIPKWKSGSSIGNSNWSTDANDQTTTWAPAPQNLSGNSAFVIDMTAATNTAMPAGTEVTDFDVKLNRTVQWAAGAIATQRAVRVRAPTYSFTAPSVITDGATVSIDGAPVADANATIVNPRALWVQSGTVSYGSQSATNGPAGYYTSVYHWASEYNTVGGNVSTATYAFSSFMRAAVSNTFGGGVAGFAINNLLQPQGGAAYTGGQGTMGVWNYNELDAGANNYYVGLRTTADFEGATFNFFHGQLVEFIGAGINAAFSTASNTNAAEAYVVNLMSTNAPRQFGFVCHTVTQQNVANQFGGCGFYVGSVNGLDSAASVAVTGGVTTHNFGLFIGQVTGGTDATNGKGYGIWVNNVSGAGNTNEAVHTVGGVVNFNGTAISSGTSSLFQVNAAPNTGGAQPVATFTGENYTNITAATQLVLFNVNLSQSYQWTTGALIGTQTFCIVQAPTVTATAATQTFTNAATFALTGAPVAGANVAFTSKAACWIQQDGLAGAVAWGATGGNMDTFFSRDGPRTLAVTGGGFGSALRVYGGGIGLGAYVSLYHDGANASIYAANGNIFFWVGGSPVYQIQPGSFFSAIGDDANDLGTSGTRFRSTYTYLSFVTTGTVYTAGNGPATDGGFWYDNGQKSMTATEAGLAVYKSGAVFSATANASLNNSAAETSMFGAGQGTQILAANWLVVGRTVIGRVSGFFTSAAFPQVVTVHVKLGASTVASVALNVVGNQANVGWAVDFEITCRTTGAGGTVIGQARVYGITSLTGLTFAVATTTTAVDTTVTQKVDLTFTTAAPDPASTYTSTNGVVSTRM